MNQPINTVVQIVNESLFLIERYWDPKQPLRISPLHLVISFPSPSPFNYLSLMNQYPQLMKP